MGGNGARGGAGQSGSGQAYYTNTLGELTHANKYSELARGSVNEDVEKGYIDAAAAFDGSGEVDNGVQIDGSTPINERAAALERAGSKINNKLNTGNLDNSIEQITKDSETVSKAKKGIMSTVMALVTLGIVGIGVVLAAKSSFIASWIAPVLAGVFAAVIIGLGMGLLGMYVNQIKHVATESLNDPGAWGHMRYWLPALLGGLPFLGMLGPAAKEGIAKGFHVTTMLQKALIMGGGLALLSSLGGFFGK